MRMFVMGAALALGGWMTSVQAADLQGNTFAVTTDQDFYSSPTHGYVTQATPGVTAGMWGFQSEWIAARSEFDLSGQTPSDSVTLSFTFTGSTSPSSLAGVAVTMPLRAYDADGVESVSDFAPNWIGDIASLNIGALSGGNVLSFDVTSLYDAAIARGDAAFGVGIDNRTFRDTFASFSNFTLTVSAVPAVPAVPEPETYALMLGGLLAVGAVARKRPR